MSTYSGGNSQFAVVQRESVMPLNSVPIVELSGYPPLKQNSCRLFYSVYYVIQLYSITCVLYSLKLKAGSLLTFFCNELQLRFQLHSNSLACSAPYSVHGALVGVSVPSSLQPATRTYWARISLCYANICPVYGLRKASPTDEEPLSDSASGCSAPDHAGCSST